MGVSVFLKVYSLMCNRDIHSGRINSQQRTQSPSRLHFTFADFYHGMYAGIKFE